MNQTVRVFILDDHAIFRESLARMLAAETGLEVVGHAASVEAGLASLAAHPADVVILDFDLGEERGSEFLEQFHAQGMPGQVLVLTAGVSRMDAERLMVLGASGIVMKHSSAGALTEAIRRVTAGERLWNPQQWGPGTSALPAERRKPLTERERQILLYVFEGLANKEIAARLQTSETTVKSGLQQLFHKMGVRTRSQLVRAALEQYRDEL